LIVEGEREKEREKEDVRVGKGERVARHG